MREIEIKAKLADKDALLQILEKKNVKLSQPIAQRDQVFGLTGVNGGDHTDPSPWLRIRTETKNGNTTQIFTLKKSVTNQLDSIEHETEIHDPAELASIIQHLGFEPYSDLTKIRQKAKMGDIEICVDAVEGLGDFIEVEKLCDDNVNYDEVAGELWGVLNECGIEKPQQVTDGYDVMMRKHLGQKP